MKIINKYRLFVHLDKFDETYEVLSPTLSAHNLVIGQLYVDIGDTMTVVNNNKPNLKCEIKYERRGWFSDEAFKLQGESFVTEGKSKSVHYRIEGNWNSKISLINKETKHSEVVWKKAPYPERVDYMYGMSKFHI